jgi:hypothetical protein
MRCDLTYIVAYPAIAAVKIEPLKIWWLSGATSEAVAQKLAIQLPRMQPEPVMRPSSSFPFSMVMTETPSDI